MAGALQNTTKLAGIYLHIPFCKQACTYCNFHFSTSLKYKDEMIAALANEALAEKGYLQGEPVETVYFGGGTPSLLNVSEIVLLLQTIRQNYPIAADAEITLEANPDDITQEKLNRWKEGGVNRLSIGVQSFFEEELRWMNRAHTAEQSQKNLQLARKHFDNITIDLIYGSPLLTDAMWDENLRRATDLGIAHLSCYALTVEEKTALHYSIDHQRSADVDPDRQAAQALYGMNYLREKGYEHYEVSNFALPGFRSRHNSSYWKGSPYLGLGPSAHSFNGDERRWNVANNSLYLKDAKGNRESETLTNEQKLNEFLMISLRTSEGIGLEVLKNTWGEAELARIEREASKYLEAGKLTRVDNRLLLTDEGMLLADGIASSFFK